MYRSWTPSLKWINHKEESHKEANFQSSWPLLRAPHSPPRISPSLSVQTSTTGPRVVQLVIESRHRHGTTADPSFLTGWSPFKHAHRCSMGTLKREMETALKASTGLLKLNIMGFWKSEERKTPFPAAEGKEAPLSGCHIGALTYETYNCYSDSALTFFRFVLW